MMITLTRLMSLLLPLLIFPLSAHAILRLKLSHWFPSGEDVWTAAAAKCQPEITAYLLNNRTEACRTPCSCAADCILDDIPETLQSNFASAQVVLGLVPAVLMLIGPSIVEVAALSTRRPLLAILVALGCPTTYISRVFLGLDVHAPLDERSRSSTGSLWAEYVGSKHGEMQSGTSRWVVARNRWLKPAWEWAAYILVLLAIGNGVEISVYTDLRTISGWRCGALFMPLVWFNLGVVEHGWGMIAARIQVWYGRQKTPHSDARTVNVSTDTGDANAGTAHTIFLTSRKSLVSAISGRLRLKPLVASQLYRCVPLSSRTVWSEVIFWVAQASALVHMIFGIFVLSSLIFITALDGVMVFARLAVSVVLCQIVVQTELTIMRLELRDPSVAVSTTASVAGSGGSSTRGINVGIPLAEISAGGGEDVSGAHDGTVDRTGTTEGSSREDSLARGSGPPSLGSITTGNRLIM